MKPTWERGNVRLYLGDCREVLPHVGKVDAVVTDPPFGVDYSSGHGSSVWGDGSIASDESVAVRDHALSMLDGVPAFVFGSWRATRPAGTRMLLVWDTLGALGMGDLSLPFKPSHQEIYLLGPSVGFCGHRGSDVIRHPPVQSMAVNGRLHPMEKPVGLMAMLIERMTGRCVCDPFMGSGTTGAAAVQTGRSFIGIEIDPTYFEIAVRRIDKAIDAGALFAPVPPAVREVGLFDERQEATT